MRWALVLVLVACERPGPTRGPVADGAPPPSPDAAAIVADAAHIVADAVAPVTDAAPVRADAAPRPDAGAWVPTPDPNPPDVWFRCRHDRECVASELPCTADFEAVNRRYAAQLAQRRIDELEYGCLSGGPGPPPPTRCRRGRCAIEGRLGGLGLRR